MKAISAAGGLLAFVSAGPALAQDEPPWAHHYLCAASAQAGVEMISGLNITVSNDGSAKDAALAKSLVPMIIQMSKEDAKEKARAARAELDKGYAAWASAEKAAGRKPASKRAVDKAAMAAARAKVDAANEAESEAIDKGCEAPEAS